MEEKIICSACGNEIEAGEVHEFDGSVLCEDCFDNCTTVCDCCGRRIWSDEAEGDEHTTLCVRCYENNYTTCEACGRVIHCDDAEYSDDDYPYCYICYDKIRNHPIKAYSYKPEPIFYGSGNLFMGVELEVDKGGEIDENAEALLDIGNDTEEHIYCKHDGSINDGFEIVSHPMSLDYHLHEMNWAKIFENALALNYRSHQTNTCGLHIHVNRTAFGETYEEQEEVIARIVFFVENHWNELLKFSRRTEESINRWASRYGISENAADTYKKAKDKHMGRYVAVNLENYSTIEFRIFRGTLRYKTFVAVLQLVDEICRVATIFNDKVIEGLSWSEFVSRIDKNAKSELIEYLKSKRLYINEDAEESEDV